MEWLTIEVFDDASAAWLWRDRHADTFVSAAVTMGAVYWEWHEHRYGVVFEVCFRDDAAVDGFRRLPAVRAALDMAPDPVNGVLVYRGRGGGAGASVPRAPRPRLGAGALALPEPTDESPRPRREPLTLLIVAR